MQPIMILKTGTSRPIVSHDGDFEDWIIHRLGPTDRPVTVRRVDQGEALPDSGSLAGLVITGSSAMITDVHPWSESCAQWLVRAVPAGLPVLGICYGHQLLAHALGGRVGPDPAGREIGTVKITLSAEATYDPLFTGLPATFVAQATHQESVLELPPGAIWLARSDHTVNQAFRIVNAWGVQFHPEFDAAVMAAYIANRAHALEAEGLDPEALRKEVSETPVASQVLRRFAAIVEQKVTDATPVFESASVSAAQPT